MSSFIGTKGTSETGAVQRNCKFEVGVVALVQAASYLSDNRFSSAYSSTALIRYPEQPRELFATEPLRVDFSEVGPRLVVELYESKLMYGAVKRRRFPKKRLPVLTSTGCTLPTPHSRDDEQIAEIVVDREGACVSVKQKWARPFEHLHLLGRNFASGIAKVAEPDGHYFDVTVRFGEILLGNI